MAMDFMTPKEAGELWGITERRVQFLCANGHIDGAQRLGDKAWMIPRTAVKPIDGRTKAAKMLKTERNEV